MRSLEGVAPTKKRTVYTIAVPTTAGTAAEATINYVITDVEKKRKFVCVDINDIPDIAIVDPDMMATMPKGLTAATGMDALTHAVAHSLGGQYNIPHGLANAVLLPLGLEPCESPQAGEVGYFTASIKNVKDTRVGDTITEAARPTGEPLPGYRPAQAMVYCGVYTEDGSKYPDLRDALEKLQLNDASLSFEPESSVALGFGFRCGFLGMLHMEIIQERLEREFDLDLITTLPSVIYEVTKTDGTVVRVDNPHNYPDPGSIKEAMEPYAAVSIIAPPDYVGAIMPT